MPSPKSSFTTMDTAAPVVITTTPPRGPLMSRRTPR
jgi:hypothetical protein